MAENDEDLVSQIKVEGGEEALSQVQQFADGSAAAFDKLNNSVNKSASAASSGFNQVGKGAEDAGKKIKTFAGIQLGPTFLRDLNAMQQGFKQFGNSLARTTQAVGRFAGRIALLGGATQAAAVGFVAGAAQIAKAAGSQDDALKKNTQAQIDANNASLSAQTAQINLASSQRQLFQQLQSGKITYQEYNKAIQESNFQYREQQRVALEVERAQQRVKEENDRLQKSLANREAMNKLIDTFGGPLTSSLIAFGNQAQAVKKSFLDSFGPGLASLVDTIGATFSKNAGTIDAFFTRMGAQLQQFVSQNGPAIQLALENIGAAAAAIFEGLIAAGPPLLAFFNNQLVPAFKAIGAFFSGLADQINAVFGTQLTGGFIILIGLLLQFSGGLRLIFALLRTGIPLFTALWKAVQLLTGGWTPLGIAIKVVIALLIYLMTNVDWSSWAATAQAAIASISGFISQLGTTITSVVNAAVAKWTEFVTFMASIPDRIANFAVGVWDAIVAKVQGAVDSVTAIWNSVIGFFTGLPDKFKVIWDSIGNFLVSAFNSAVEKVKTYVRDLAASAMKYLQPIVDLINTITGGTAGFSGGGPVPAFSGGGKVRGPGTETSDSIWARLSNNEFVMRAKAVRKYGVSLMNSINEGRFKVPKFNMGGLNVIGPALPRTNYADGGPVNSTANLRPITLSVLGETFTGLLGPEDVVGRMTKFALARQARSGGRKPEWVGKR